MSLRIRRGTEAQRTGATFDLGEIVYATDTNKLYVGDGVNLGGKNILATSAGTGLIWNATTQRLDYNGSGTGIVSVQADANPTLGGNLNLNNRNITGTGNISITGTVTATQFVGIPSPATLTQNLSLNTRSITGTGDINLVGASTITAATVTAATITATTKLNVSNIEANNLSGLNVNVNGTTPLSVTGIGTLGATSGQVYLNINAAKGTIASPTTSAAGDGLGGIAIQGYNGTNYKMASLIVSSWDASATLSDTFPKSKLTLITGGGGSTLRQATLDNQGVFTASILKAGSYSTTEMNAIASPAAGMIIFNTTASDFYGYNGSAWVAFTGP
jgi:hypothetical protein